MKAALISDIHGAEGGDITYMQAWTAVLQQRGYTVRPLFLDALCPAAYQARPFSKEVTHRHFVQGGIDSATLALQAVVASDAFDLLLGFSLGGYLACQVRHCLPARASIVCISATRLRLIEGGIAGACPIHAVFGEDDPFRPQTAPVLGGIQQDYLIAQAGHDIYLEPARCRFVLDGLNDIRPPDRAGPA